MKFQQSKIQQTKSKKTWIIIAVIVIVVVALLLLFFLTKDKIIQKAGGAGAGTNISSNVEATARLTDVAGDISSLREELDGLASEIG